MDFSLARWCGTFGLTMCCIGLSGCHTYTKLPVRVIDAQTRQPIQGASVKVEYAHWFRWPPDDSKRLTDPNGKAVMRIVADYPYPAWLAVDHPGFESKDQYRFDIRPRPGEPAEGWHTPSSTPVLLDESATNLRAGETALIELQPRPVR